MGIKVAIVGVGNWASSLVQGGAHYSNGGANEAIGLIPWDMAGYRPRDINIVAAWDVDRRKVGKDVSEAIFARPNCTTVFSEHVPPTGTTVLMGRILDVFAAHMEDFPIARQLAVSDAPAPRTTQRRVHD